MSERENIFARIREGLSTEAHGLKPRPARLVC